MDLRNFFNLASKYLYKNDNKKILLEWLAWCKRVKEKYSIKNEKFIKDKKGLLNPYRAMFKISDLLEEGDKIVCGNASACIIPFQSLEIKKNQRLFSNSGSASMGYDLPAAIGAAIADNKSDNSRVICIAGDGSLQMNVQELQTLASLNLNLKIFLINNKGYLSIKSTHQNFFGEVFGSDPDSGIDFPNFVKIAKAYGIKAYKIFSYRSLNKLDSILNKKEPALIELMVDTEQEFCPKLKSRMDNNGNFITPELDDMYPFLKREDIINISKV